MEAVEIEKLIRSLGISATYRGYHYLNYCITLCLQNDNYHLSTSKYLYPHIAHSFYTTPSSVERNMRTIVKVCWERGNKDYLQQLSLHPLVHCPPVSEFIDILVNHFRSP